MVSSAKLHRAQQWIGNMVPYQSKLSEMLTDLLATGVDISSFAAKNDSKRVAVVAFSSNSSLCGGFNANAIKNFHNAIQPLLESGLAKEDIDVYAFGKKINESLRKSGFNVVKDYSFLIDKPSYDGAAEVARTLIENFNNNEVGRVMLVYNHYKSNASQPPVQEVFLPFNIKGVAADEDMVNDEDLIIEPSPREVVEVLLPKVMKLKIYTVLLDNYAAEHAARTLAMQIASDNANDLLGTLNLEYNKSRQQAITNELLDIVGGSLN